MRFPFGVQMTVVRAGRLLAALGVILAGSGCGDTYRPIAIPIQPIPPTPAALHYVVSLSVNGVCPPQAGENCGRGASTRIDVSGDSRVGTAQVGLNPVHAVVIPNGSSVYVANQMEDTVSFYSPSNVAPVSSVSLPAGSAPVFVTATDNTSVYVANSGNNTVSDISTSSEVIVRTINVGKTPVALAELPNAQKVYVANRGSGAAPVNGSVQAINNLDGSVSPIASSSWNSPVWAVARGDNARVYALDQGTGLVSAIDTSVDAVVGTATVQPGANFILYDRNLSRLYVTNPLARSLTVLSAASDALPVLGTISFAFSAASNAACPNPSGCLPLSVAALPDGSRVYVASYQVSPACSEPADANPLGCITAQVTVLQASDLAVTKSIAIALPDNVPNPPAAKPDTPVIATCNSARFRLSTAASVDSTRVYVSYCDAGATAVIRTTPDTSPGSQNGGDYLVNNLSAPAGLCTANTCAAGSQPPPQTPVFVLQGP
jgi:YVTN family beta-propeller protein